MCAFIMNMQTAQWFHLMAISILQCLIIEKWRLATLEARTFISNSTGSVSSCDFMQG